MRVPLYEFLADAVAHVVEGEAALLGFHLGVEHDLQQQIAQFLHQQSLVLLVDCLDDLVSLLDQILFDALVRLLSVPRTAARRTQKLHDADQVVDGVAILKIKMFDHGVSFFIRGTSLF